MRRLAMVYSILVTCIFLASCAGPVAQHLNKANSYYDAGQWDYAIAEYGQVIELDSANLEALNNRGSAYSERGEYDLAITDCTRVLELDPGNIIAYYNRSIAYLRRGDVSIAHGNRGKAEDDWKNAIKDCSAIIDTGFQNAFVLLHRGLAHKNLKDYEATMDDFTKALSISSSPEFQSNVKQSIDEVKKLQSQGK